MKIMEHMDKNELFTYLQYGFRNKRSTVLQLLKVLNQWTEMLDEGNCLDVPYIDFSKAFDTVPHCHLMTKLQAYAIGGKMLDWVKDFLTHRRQRLSINGSLSQWLAVLSGIPQGSVLGHVLFILYIKWPAGPSEELLCNVICGWHKDILCGQQWKGQK